MRRRPPICGSLRLRTTAQEYVLEGDGYDRGAALRLQRSQTDEVYVTQLPPMSGYGELGESVPIVGVVGVVHLLSGPYLLVVAGAGHVGKLLGHDVYRVTDVHILPFAADLSGLPAPRQQDEQLYLSMLRTFLTSRHLYFSYTMDLTNSLQEQVRVCRTFISSTQFLEQTDESSRCTVELDAGAPTQPNMEDGRFAVFLE